MAVPASSSLRSSEAALEGMTVEGVTFSYESGPVVVSSVTAALRPGRLCVLLGPNAAGKSTLLKLMLGHLTPDRGAVSLGGRPVHLMSPRGRAVRMSYVPQRAQASFAFTVRQVVEMGRYAAGSDASLVRSVLERCELVDIEHRIFAELSGGQQQRVLIARALAQIGAARGVPNPPSAMRPGTVDPVANPPRVMLLDEPANNMDLRHAHALMRLLRDQARAGLAVLAVLHDLNLSARYADDVWLMHEGRLVAAGPWHDVLRPDLLEPVYGVGLRRIEADAADRGDRPVFLVTNV